MTYACHPEERAAREAERKKKEDEKKKAADAEKAAFTAGLGATKSVKEEDNLTPEQRKIAELEKLKAGKAGVNVQLLFSSSPPLSCLIPSSRFSMTSWTRATCLAVRT